MNKPLNLTPSISCGISQKKKKKKTATIKTKRNKQTNKQTNKQKNRIKNHNNNHNNNYNNSKKKGIRQKKAGTQTYTQLQASYSP